MFLEENLGKPETTAGEFLGIRVTDECDAFLADLGQIDLAGELGDRIRIEFRTR